jgi:hypothetical protein
MLEGDIIGFVASALVLATFAMKDMRHLRAMAIVSNLAFVRGDQWIAPGPHPPPPAVTLEPATAYRGEAR